MIRKRAAWVRRPGALAAAVLSSLMLCSTAWAGEWVITEDLSWRYEEDDGSVLTGWQKLDGIWYLLEEETGNWISRPAITKDSVICLMENALYRAGYYQNEKYPMFLQVESNDKHQITLTVRLEKDPVYNEIVNTYRIDKRTGVAKGIKGTDVSLY